jgi:hypothetical protein
MEECEKVLMAFEEPLSKVTYIELYGQIDTRE